MLTPQWFKWTVDTETLLSNHSLPWLIHHITSTLAWTQTTREIPLQTAEWKSHDTETGRCDICTRAKKVCMYTTYSLWRTANAPNGSFMFFLRWIWPSSTRLLPEVPFYLRSSQARVTFLSILSIDWISKTTGTWLDEGALSTNTQIWSNKKRIQTPRALPSSSDVPVLFLNKLADLCRQLI